MEGVILNLVIMVASQVWAIDPRSERKFRLKKEFTPIIQGSRELVESFKSMNKPRVERDGEKGDQRCQRFKKL